MNNEEKLLLDVLSKLYEYKILRKNIEDEYEIRYKETIDAKKRINIKGKVDEFIEDIQFETGKKNIKTIEVMLSALCKEIINESPSISLNLRTERGLPSLDIVAVTGGVEEDVYEDNGGALTNVITMGLRLIAVVKSRKEKFLLLDEPDCWIKPSSVPRFYAVLEDAAKKLGVQCLVISHHKFEDFGEKINKIEIVKDKGETKAINNISNDITENKIKKMSLINFQSHKELEIVLSGGVNAVFGENNIGKSAITRALRAVFYGETRDSLIKHGENSCSVEIQFNDEKILKYIRSKKNPVNRWVLMDKEGSCITIDGSICDTTGRDVPTWVKNVKNIDIIEGLDVHLSHQKRPVFLLSEPASKRASVLSIGRESDYVRVMAQIQKERVGEDSLLIRENEKKLDIIRNKKIVLQNIDDIYVNAKKCEDIYDTYKKEEEKIKSLEDIIYRLNFLFFKIDNLRKKSSCINKIVKFEEKIDILSKKYDEEEKISDCLVKIEMITKAIGNMKRKKEIISALSDEFINLNPVDIHVKSIRAIKEKKEYLTMIRDKVEILKFLKNQPELKNEENLIKYIENIKEIKFMKKNNENKIIKLNSDEEEIRKTMNVLIEKFGRKCPLCDGNIDIKNALIRCE